MPYSTETERRRAEKAWRQRGSDGKATRQSPPGFILAETAIETPGNPPTEVYAIKHTHTYAPDEPDWVMERENG